MNEKIHFDDFAEQVALEVGVDVDTAKDYIYTMFETIIEENERGEWVKIRNFGSFHPVHNKEKRARNPQTGNFMTIPAHYHVNFKPSATLSNVVNIKYGHLHPQVIEEDRKNAMPIFIGGIAVLMALIAALFFLLSGGDEEMQPAEAPIVQEDAADAGRVVEEKPAVEALPPVEGLSSAEVEPKEMGEADGDDVVEGKEPERLEAMHAEEAAETAPAATPGRVQAPSVGETGIVYTVSQRDTLTEISEDAYENSDFWPMIFANNYLIVRDPDLIYPKTELSVPRRPDLTETADMDTMYSGYIQAYKRYKGLGKDQKAIWLLFRGYMKVDKGILDQPEISEEDKREALDYIRRHDP